MIVNSRISIKIILITMILVFLSSINSKNLRHLQDSVLLEKIYGSIIKPDDSNYTPIEDDSKINLNKPEYIIVSNSTEASTTTISKYDYEYTGSLGLGSGVIAIIVFMIFGVFVCIYGLSTEYYV